MANEARVINEHTPVTVALQVHTAPYPVADVDAQHQASPKRSNADRHRDKVETFTSSPNLAKTKPVAVTSTESEPMGTSTDRPEPGESPESTPGQNSSDDEQSADVMERASNVRSEKVSASGDLSVGQLIEESKCVERIERLWAMHLKRTSLVVKSRADLERLRLTLAKELHAYKQVLVGAGRDGRWAPFLREQRIPVATANRLVKRHESSLAPDSNKLLNEQHKVPTAEEVSRMVKRLEPKLTRLLTTPDSIAQFMSELDAVLKPSTLFA